MTIANAVLPQELKEAGWKLGEKIVNDDEKKFYVTNQRLGQGTGDCKDLDDAITGAVTLHFRNRGKKVSRKEIERYVKENSRPSADAQSELPAAPVQELAFNKIRRDGGTQPRAQLDPATVDRYAEDKKHGAKFPPGIVFYDGKNHWLARGFHRTAADEKNGQKKAEFEVRQGTRRDAILFSVGENHDHGLPRTNDEKRRAALRLLEDAEWSQWSDGSIAIAAKVSQPFVSKLRREIDKLTQNVLSEHEQVLHGRAAARHSEPKAPQPTTRIGKDKREIETKAIGKKAVAPVKSAQDAQAPLQAEDYPAGWFEQQIAINLTTKPGTISKRPLVVSGKVGEADPVFLNFTSNDLNPMPPALAELFSQLLKSYKKLVGKASSAKGGRK